MTMQECYKAIGGNYEAVLVNWHKLAVEYNYSKSTAEAVAKISIKMLWGIEH